MYFTACASWYVALGSHYAEVRFEMLKTLSKEFGIVLAALAGLRVVALLGVWGALPTSKAT
jgi:hypothetical protein